MAETQASWKKEPESAGEGQQEKKESKMIALGKNANIKKSFRRRFIETFIADDVTKEDIREYIVKDVIVPAIQDAIMDGINGALGLMFGITIARAGRSIKSSSSSGSKISYSSSFSSEKDKEKSRSIERRDRRGGGYEIQMVDEKTKADSILREIEEDIRQYGKISVADYYDYFGKETDFPDNDYGWRTANGVYIQRVPNGFVDEETGRYKNGWAVVMPREIQIR